MTQHDVIYTGSHDTRYIHTIQRTRHIQENKTLCLRMSISTKCLWRGMSLTNDMSSDGDRMSVGAKTTERL